jgi:hypothetical protein
VSDDVELVWTPTIAAVDAAVRARRRATRVTWLEWVFSGAGIAFFGAGVYAGQLGAVLPLVLCVLFGSGLWGFGYRWVVHYRYNPQLFTEVRLTLTDAGIVENQAGVTINVAWDHWSSYLHMRDAIAVMAANNGNTSFILLHRRAAPDDATWADVLTRVESHLPPHPHDPGRRESVRS